MLTYYIELLKDNDKTIISFPLSEYRIEISGSKKNLFISLYKGETEPITISIRINRQKEAFASVLEVGSNTDPLLVNYVYQKLINGSCSMNPAGFKIGFYYPDDTINEVLREIHTDMKLGHIS